MGETEQKPETPSAFLKGVGEALQVTAGVDTDLAQILCERILVAPSAGDAVARARAAITALAESRATKVEGASG
jgi:hypothetical protein